MRFEEVRLGEELPELRKPMSLVQLVAYAGATWDFHRYHYDRDFARALGLSGPIADGQMFGAFLSQLVLSWAGPDAFLKKLAFRLRSPVYPGDVVFCWGRVSGVDVGSRTVTLELGIRAQDGRNVVTPASAVIELGDF